MASIEVRPIRFRRRGPVTNYSMACGVTAMIHCVCNSAGGEDGGTVSCEQSAASFFFCSVLYLLVSRDETRLRLLVSMRSWTEVVDISVTIGSVVAFQELNNTIILVKLSLLYATLYIRNNLFL
jgi:hypothetical protein